MNNKQTFNQMLTSLETPNSKRLMRRARRANRIAKRVYGKNRRNAYRVKSRALCSLVNHLPEQTDIRKDIILTDFVVVELKGAETGLHVPVRHLERSAA
jgi:ribosomal protein L25 (general stress protein Ctc)